jgi:ABC-type transporter Mla subunit MlaD
VNSDTILAPLARERRHVSGAIRNSSEVARATVERRVALAADIQKLPTFLSELTPTMVRVGALSDEMTPVLSDLDAVAPDINRLVQELGPFSTAAIPAVESLGEMTKTGTPAVKAALPVTRDLRSLAAQLKPVGLTARQLLESFQRTDGIQRAMDYIFYQVAADQRLRLVRPLPARRPDRQPVRDLRDQARVRLLGELRPGRLGHRGERVRDGRPARPRAGADGAGDRRVARTRQAEAAEDEEGEEGEDEEAQAAQAPRARPAHAAGRRRAAGDAHAHAHAGAAAGQPVADRHAARLSVRGRRMKSRGSGIAGNPVLIGAATILVVLVAVFLAYNANKGLPFVPTYELKARGPERGEPGRRQRRAHRRLARRLRRRHHAKRRDNGTTVAVLTLTLEKSVAPLPRDSTLIIRPRSALGLKYVEITARPERRRATRRRHDPARRRARRRPVEFDEVLSMFDEEDARRDRREHLRLRRRASPAAASRSTRDRRLPAAAARHHAGRAEPARRPDRPARLLPRARSRRQRSSPRRPRRRPSCS